MSGEARDERERRKWLHGAPVSDSTYQVGCLAAGPHVELPAEGIDAELVLSQGQVR